MLSQSPSPTLDRVDHAPRSGIVISLYGSGKDVVASERSEGEAALSEQTRWMMAVRDARDREAFGRLFDHFAPRLKAMLMRGGMAAAAAEDVVQDVMLTAWRKADQFDPGRAEVSAWLYRIARNRQVDIARREARPMPEEIAPPEAHEDDAGQSLSLEQESERLRGALAALSPDQRALVERAYFGELTHTEIRAETGLPLGTIKSRIRLGLRRLRHELRDLEQK